MDKEKLERRIRRYGYAVNSGLPGQQPEWKKRAAVVAYTRGAGKLLEIEEGVRGVLSTESVPTIEVMWYMIYAKGIGRLIRDFHGIERLKTEVAQLTAKWAKNGLKEAIMKRIREELFALHDSN